MRANSLEFLQCLRCNQSKELCHCRSEMPKPSAPSDAHIEEVEYQHAVNNSEQLDDRKQDDSSMRQQDARISISDMLAVGCKLLISTIGSLILTIPVATMIVCLTILGGIPLLLLLNAIAMPLMSLLIPGALVAVPALPFFSVVAGLILPIAISLSFLMVGIVPEGSAWNERKRRLGQEIDSVEDDSKVQISEQNTRSLMSRSLDFTAGFVGALVKAIVTTVAVAVASVPNVFMIAATISLLESMPILVVVEALVWPLVPALFVAVMLGTTLYALKKGFDAASIAQQDQSDSSPSARHGLFASDSISSAVPHSSGDEGRYAPSAPPESEVEPFVVDSSSSFS